MDLNDIKLIPLRCPECGGAIDSKEEDRIHFCSVCGSGFQVVGDKFKKVDVLYAKPQITLENKIFYYLPMWEILTTVSLKMKYSVNLEDLPEEIIRNRKFSELLTSLFNEKEAKKKMIFFVPAFGVTNRYHLMDQPGFQFTVNPPKLEKDSPKNMVGAEYSLEDAEEIAKVMFLSIRAHTRADILDANINFDFHRYRIVGIPFFEEKGMLVDGIKGYRIFKDALRDWDRLKKHVL
ncbi:MAG: hypothetical protein U9N06_07485 [candidate division WOR-3 bacterium]|nr:hypothetical protein [candidate division WOR-3 bacterium]